jgi:hypothetical protein
MDKNNFGNLIYKLSTIDHELWENQEFLYEIKRMTFEEFDNKYCKTIDSKKYMLNILNNLCDLNLERNKLIDAIDEKIIEIIKGAVK